jgi:DNA polymerase III delta prime subunit
MFFDDLKNIQEIASRTGTSVFVIPEDKEISIKGALTLSPEAKSVITIEQVREITRKLELRQTANVYIIVRPADKLGPDAANAFLKSLEEPGDKVHFVLITSRPSLLLPTITSRAAIYIWRDPNGFNLQIEADEKIKTLAKKLIAAKGNDLVNLADEIKKKKDGVRDYALSILGVAIEMLYKSFLLTKKEMFLARIPQFLAAYEAISRNGNVKLQIVANLA